MQMDGLRRWIQGALLMLMCGRAVAEYRFDVWTTDSGLPHNTVRAIVQTRDGYLWAGTADGLARFDGVRFTVFNKANSPGFPNNRIMTLYEAHDGALWIGFEDGSVARYQHGGFTAFGAEQGLPAGPVPGIWENDDGSLRVYSYSKSAEFPWRSVVLRLHNGRFQPDLPENADSLLTRPGWVLKADALHVFSRGKLTTFGLSNGLPSLRITSVKEEPQGTWWFATEDAGVVKLRDGKIVKRYTQQDGLLSDRVSFGPGPWVNPLLCEDRKGNLWLTGAGPWLGRLRDGIFSAYAETNTPSLQVLARVPGSPVNALLEDSEGNVWIATDRAGLIRAREQAVNVISTEQGLGFQTANIYPVFEDRFGAVWLGNWALGLGRVATGVVTNFPLSGGDQLVTALYEDRAGQLWVATYGGVSIFQNGTLTKAGVPTGLTNGIVRAICQDRSSAFWFGAEQGLSRYQDGQLSTFTEQDGLAGGIITVIIEDRAGALWIGSYRGLTRWANGRFTAWTEQDGLLSSNVRALYEDGDGTLWIGSADGGLSRFKAGQFTHYTTRDGLFDDGTFQILEDARGNFWMSSNRGIHRVNKRELNEFAEGRRKKITSVAYGKADGMLDAECNGGRWPAGVQTRDGKLWFPTQNGVAVIDPAALSANLKPPPAVIEGFLVDREPQALDGPLRIPPGKADIEISYTGLSFINSEWLSFKYRLVGVDKDWTEVGRRRAAYYSHLAPGHYMFTVVAANSDGVWNDTGASLDFVVLPTWYQTRTFRALAFVALAGLALGVFRSRVNLIEQRRAAQESFSRELLQQQEAERKRIAGELHDGLGQALLVIKNTASIAGEAAAAPDEMRADLAAITRLSTNALDEVRTITHALRPPELDRLGLTKALEHVVQLSADAGGLKCSVQVEPLDGCLAPPAEIQLYRVVQECLNNVVKHARAGYVEVRVWREGRHLHARVQDNGEGFDLAHKSGSPKSKGGLGLAGMTERVRLLGGEIAIRSQPGSGTVVEATLPVEVSSAQTPRTS